MGEDQRPAFGECFALVDMGRAVPLVIKPGAEAEGPALCDQTVVDRFASFIEDFASGDARIIAIEHAFKDTVLVIAGVEEPGSLETA